jgi:hypothetical protein
VREKLKELALHPPPPAQPPQPKAKPKTKLPPKAPPVEAEPEGYLEAKPTAALLSATTVEPAATLGDRGPTRGESLIRLNSSDSGGGSEDDEAVVVAAPVALLTTAPPEAAVSEPSCAVELIVVYLFVLFVLLVLQGDRGGRRSC